MAEAQVHLQQHSNGAAAAAAAVAEVAASGFSLPEHIIAVLPSDPYEQLDLARKITSIALATRLAKLEDEATGLRAAVADRDNLIDDLRVRIDSLGASLADLSGQLTSAQEEKETLLNENASLSSTVKKLNRDVSKLEVFKKTLMQSLQEEDEIPQVSDSRKAHMLIKKSSILSSGSLSGEEDSANPPLKSSSASETRNAISYDGDSSDVDVSKRISLKSLNLPSHDGTPRLTPPDSPPRLVTGLTPKRLSRPLSPRRHSISVATTRNMFDDRSEIFKSMPPAHSSSMTSPFDTGAQTGRTRVDGKEFFSRVRSRLSYEQFSAFIANVKELNSHKQTREETLRKAGEIFGPNNKDLYTNFDGLINRNLH